MARYIKNPSSRPGREWRRPRQRLSAGAHGTTARWQPAVQPSVEPGDGTELTDERRRDTKLTDVGRQGTELTDEGRQDTEMTGMGRQDTVLTGAGRQDTEMTDRRGETGHRDDRCGETGHRADIQAREDRTPR